MGNVKKGSQVCIRSVHCHHGFFFLRYRVLPVQCRASDWSVRDHSCFGKKKKCKPNRKWKSSVLDARWPSLLFFCKLGSTANTKNKQHLKTFTSPLPSCVLAFNLFLFLCPSRTPPAFFFSPHSLIHQQHICLRFLKKKKCRSESFSSSTGSLSPLIQFVTKESTTFPCSGLIVVEPFFSFLRCLSASLVLSFSCLPTASNSLHPFYFFSFYTLLASVLLTPPLCVYSDHRLDVCPAALAESLTHTHPQLIDRLFILH